jgi:hypothetical protein
VSVIIAAGGRNSVASSDDSAPRPLSYRTKRACVPAGSKLAEDSPGNAKLVLDDEMSHVVWKTRVVARRWFHI